MIEHFIDERIRNLIQEETIQVSEIVENKWKETLYTLPEKKRYTFNIKILGAIAAAFLLSVSIYAIYAQNPIESSEPEVMDVRAKQPVEAALSGEENVNLHIQDGGMKAYSLSEIKQGFPHVVYGFQADIFGDVHIRPVSYQLLNTNPDEEILEITYQVGEVENGFVLRQTLLSDEMKKNVQTSFETMVDYQGITLYQPVAVGHEIFYLFSMNPETEAVFSGEVIRDLQWIQMQSMAYALSEVEFTILFESLQAQ